MEYTGLLRSNQLTIEFKVLTSKAQKSFSFTTHPAWPWRSGPSPWKFRIPLKDRSWTHGSIPCLRRSQSQGLSMRCLSNSDIRGQEKSFLGRWVTQSTPKPQFSLKATLLFTHSFTPTTLPECSLLGIINHTLIFFPQQFL